MNIADLDIINLDGTIYPCTIVQARYSGTYEGAIWLAFPLESDHLPEGWNGDDLECMEFWDTYEKPVGKGNDPITALKDLHVGLEKLGVEGLNL